MAEILVPIISEGIASLYKVKANLKTSETEVITLCNRIKGQASEGVDCIIDKLHEFFGKEINISIGLRNIETGKVLKADSISMDTQSITLGVLAKAIELVENRFFRKNYDYIILTGNYKGRMLLSVSDIDKKYTGIKKFAEKNKSKKLFFMFISDEKLTFCREGWNKNIYVKYLKTNTSINFIYPELFILDSKKYQSCGLSKVKEPLNIDLTRNNGFQNIKKQFINHEIDNGVLIYGPKGSIKNVLAFQLCEFLIASQIIQMPIWIDFSGSDNTIEWIEKTINKFLSGTDYNLDNLSNKKIVTVISNILPAEIANTLELINNFFENNKINSLFIITSVCEPADVNVLLKYGIKTIPVKRDYFYIIRKNRIFLGIIVFLISIIAAYLVYAYKEFCFNYTNIVITQNGFSGRNLSNYCNQYVYKLTYRKGKLIKIDFINSVFNKKTTTDLYNLISFSTIKLEYLNSNEISKIKFYDENGFFIASYQIEKDFTNLRLNLNNIGATPLLQYYYPDNTDYKYEILNNRIDFLRINSIMLSFNAETGFLDEVCFYKTHNSFEPVHNSEGISGVNFIYDSTGLISDEIFISADTQINTDNNTVYKTHYQYDAFFNLVEIKNIDINGNLIDNNRNWAKKKYYFADDQIITEYRNSKDIPVFSSIYKFHEKKLQMIQKGSNIFTDFEFDNKNNVISFSMLKNSEQKVKCSFEYEKNNIIKQSFLQNEKLVVNQQEEYSYTTYRYGKDSIEQKYYDNNGKPCDNKNSISGIHITLDSDRNILKQELSSITLSNLRQK